MGISETKKQIVIDNYFKNTCDVNTSIKEAFTKGFEVGLTKAVFSKDQYEARLKADTTEKFKEFRDKLSKWMFHNSESVCGCSMIDIDYLEGQMDELLYELGIYEVVEDGN